jgi:dipeptidyl aminopeptidase/acylaminoacyl peptidase
VASYAILSRSADGSGDAQVLLPPQPEVAVPISFSPDGRTLAMVLAPGGNLNLLLMPLDPPGAPRPFLATQFTEADGRISPDGRWIAYVSDETGNPELYVRPFPAGPGKWQLSSAGALEPHWSADGRALYFRGFGGRLMRVAVEPGATFRASPPEPLIAGFQTAPGPATYGIAPDGRRFLTLPLVRPGQNLRAVDYSDDWLVRARRLLAAHE